MDLSGLSFLAGKRGAATGKSFQASNPQSGELLAPTFHSASTADVDEAAKRAAEAFETYSQASGKAKAAFLRRAADGFDAHRDELAARANLETSLPMPRLLG